MDFSRVDEKDNILIIDDVSSNLLSLTEIARSLGLNPRPVKSVSYARRAINAELPNLILLDITMPDENGFDYCRELKKDPRTKNIPVIFISGLNSREDRVKAFECGGVDYITKPFEPTEVSVRIDTHLKIYHTQKETEATNKHLHALVNQQLHQIDQERRNLIISVANIAEGQREGSADHLRNIGENTRILAIGLSLSRKYEKAISNYYVQTIETAALMHDLGKIAMPFPVLNKPAPLDETEWATMAKHTERGVELLREMLKTNSGNDFLRMALQIAECHHEKWDGTGFPSGMSGNDIPLSARIVSVVDTYDMLVGERCYKKPYSKTAALAYIEKESGKSFDPEVVDVFLRLKRRLIGDVEGAADEEIPEEIANDMRR